MVMDARRDNTFEWLSQTVYSGGENVSSQDIAFAKYALAYLYTFNWSPKAMNDVSGVCSEYRNSGKSLEDANKATWQLHTLAHQNSSARSTAILQNDKPDGLIVA